VNYQYIDTLAALTEWCKSIRGTRWLALDTEFVREKTYFSQLCLIQVASEDRIACVDPLAINDLTPLLNVIYDATIVKIVHAGYQDLEIFFHLRHSVPNPLFDTQIAAAMLGQGEQISYAKLVQAVLDIEIDKSETRTDWSQRPLRPAQLDYAANDVRYLGALYRHQQAELARLKRTDWLAENFAALGNAETYANATDLVWQRIHGHHRLRGVQLAVLRDLAGWREAQAQAVNLPRKWILRDDILVELARRLPKNRAALKQVRGLDDNAQTRYGKILLEIIATSSAAPQDSWPPPPSHPPHLTPAQEALVDAMMALVRLRGAQQNINPQLLASRKDLQNLLTDKNTPSPLLQGWRAALVGHEVQALMEGELRLEVRDNQLQVVTN
jgi:ribonuclease D